MHAQQMVATHPHVRGPEDPALVACIEACFACAQTCIACADACLGEEMVAELTQCTSGLRKYTPTLHSQPEYAYDACRSYGDRSP